MVTNLNGCKPFYILTICVHFDDLFGIQQFKMFLKKIKSPKNHKYCIYFNIVNVFA